MSAYERIDNEDTGWKSASNRRRQSIFFATVLIFIGVVGYTQRSNDSETLTISSEIETTPRLNSMLSSSLNIPVGDFAAKTSFSDSNSGSNSECGACAGVDHEECMRVLTAAFVKLEDADKLTLEKEIFKGKYSCGSSLSEDHCLSYLDGKFGVMSDTEKFSVLLETCNDGTLPLPTSLEPSVAHNTRNEVVSYEGGDSYSHDDSESYSNGKHVMATSNVENSASLHLTLDQEKIQAPTKGMIPAVAGIKMSTTMTYSCEACDNLDDENCILVLENTLVQMPNSERLALEANMLKHKYKCGISVKDDACLSYLDTGFSSLDGEERLSLLTKSCYEGELTVVSPRNGAGVNAQTTETEAISKASAAVDQLASTHFHRSCNGGCSAEKVSLGEAKDEWMHRADVMEMASQKVVYGNLTSDEIRALFTKFQVEFDRSYDKKEEDLRFDIFKKNLKFIDALNRQNPLALFGITECSDHTEAERSKRKMSSRWSDYDTMKASLPTEVVEAAAAGPSAVTGKTFDANPHLMERGMVSWASEDECAACEMFPALGQYNTSFLPERFDWRELGAVTAVKNQKYCGSCWSFAAVQDIEGVHFLATGNLTSFSEQQLIACDERNYGCDGGWMYAAMQYVADFGAIVPEYAYPYQGIYMNYNQSTPTCDQELISRKLQENGQDIGHISGFQMVAMGGEYERLMETVLLKNGPLALAVNANGMEYYVRGIIGCETIAGKDYCNSASIDNHTPCDPTALDHGVLAIGFGEQENTEYWVIKNSWGSQWGEDGYVRMERGNNKCGIANMVQHSVYKKMKMSS